MKRRRHGKSGYALLLVFLMAAMIALSLYLELPRVAFDTQRQKEDLLVYRGEQYKRAIEVYVRQNHHYPAKIEDLETTGNRHYLRRRYIDPMTGKDEWRAVHSNGMVLTDSKVQPQPQQGQKDDKDTTAGQYVGIVAGLGEQPGANGSTVNLALRKRDSDNNVLPPPGGASPGSPANPGDPAARPGSTASAGAAPGMPPVPGMPPAIPGQNPLPGQAPPVIPGVPMPGQPAQSGAPGNSGAAATNGGSNSGGSSYLGSGGSYLGGGGSYIGGSAAPPGLQRPAGTVNQAWFGQGMPVNSLTGGVSAQPGNPFAGAAGAGGPTMNPTAAQMIGNLLTQPRPGGMPMAGTNGMQTMGGGIAGFASKADQDSIMVYNDQTNYGLWEFIFDPNKVKPLPNPNTGPVGTPASQVANQSQGGQSPFTAANPFSNPAQTGQPASTNPFANPQPGPRQQ